MRPKRLDREAAVLELAGLAADAAGEPVGDRADLQGGARQVDARPGMTGEIVRLQHAERGVDPAEIGIALVERRGDRQGVALRRLRRRPLEPVVERQVGRRSELSRQQARAGEAQDDDKPFHHSSANVCASAYDASRDWLGRMDRPPQRGGAHFGSDCGADWARERLFPIEDEKNLWFVSELRRTAAASILSLDAPAQAQFDPGAVGL